MEYKQSESKERPAEVEAIPGGRYLLRKNIKEVERTGADGTTTTHFEYEEAIADSIEYGAIVAGEAVKLRQEQDIVDEYTLALIEEGVL